MCIFREFLERLESQEDEQNLDKLQEELENVNIACKWLSGIYKQNNNFAINGQLRIEEMKLQDNLCKLESSEKELELECSALAVEKDQMLREEDSFWHDYADLQRQILLCEDEQRRFYSILLILP